MNCRENCLGVFAIALLSLSLAICPAAAEGEKCLYDVEKFCSGVQPGGGRVEACLKGNEKKISAACRRSLREHHEGLKNYFTDCQEDARKYCRGKRGGATVQKCLTKNKRKLGNKCRISLKKSPKLEE